MYKSPPSRKGVKHTEETKHKISKALKGRKPYKMTDEIRENMSKAKKGTKHTDNWEEAMREKMKGNTNGFSKNNTPWNKGKEFFAIRGEKNINWKGDKAGYISLHKWIARKLGKPKFCEHCKSTKKAMYHWANISGEYKRDVKDWKRLCVPCHSKYDREKKIR